VLVTAGALKRGAAPGVSETVLLMRALRDSNVPKLLPPDAPLFEQLLADLFPGLRVSSDGAEELRGAVVAELEAAGLQPLPALVDKIVQLQETASVRFGVCLVGGTGSGKSTAHRTLAAALTRLRAAGSANPAFQRVKTAVLNPKAVSLVSSV
jgi:dynein heavy chain